MGITAGLVHGLTTAVAGDAEGQREVRDKNMALASLLLQRQMQQELTNSRARYYNTRSDALEHPQPKLDEQLHTRVQQLVEGGMPLDQAATQARKEYGQTTPSDPTAVHAANRRFDVEHPLPTRGRGGAGGSGVDRGLVSAASGARAIAGQDRSAADRAQSAFEVNHFGGAPDPAAKQYKDNRPGYVADSTDYATGSQRVQRLMARADSTGNIAHALTKRVEDAATGGDDSGDSDVAGSSPAAAPAAAAPRSGTAKPIGPNNRFDPAVLKLHQQIDAAAQRAIAAGADPAKVSQLAATKHAALQAQVDPTAHYTAKP